jgi:hypothetical protein
MTLPVVSGKYSQRANRQVIAVTRQRLAAGLTDPSGIRAELKRIRRALPDDPAGAIGAAKQLVEATAKVVLTERHLPVAADAKFPSS